MGVGAQEIVNNIEIMKKIEIEANLASEDANPEVLLPNNLDDLLSSEDFPPLDRVTGARAHTPVINTGGVNVSGENHGPRWLLPLGRTIYQIAK